MNTRLMLLFSCFTGLLVSTPALAETVYDNTHSAIAYGGAWIMPTYSTAYAGTLSEANVAGASASLSFTGGKYVSLVYTMGADRYKSDIYIDGVYKETINARTTGRRWQIMKTWPVNPYQIGHSIRVVARGPVDGQPASLAWSDVDAFIVDPDVALPGFSAVTASYAPDIWLATYVGTWNTVSDGLGYRLQSQRPGEAVRLSFYGDSVLWTHLTTGNRGIAEITLDGAVQPDVDTYGTGGSTAYGWYGLTPGLHTLTIGVSGRKNPLSNNVVVDVMGFTVSR